MRMGKNELSGEFVMREEFLLPRSSPWENFQRTFLRPFGGFLGWWKRRGQARIAKRQARCAHMVMGTSCTLCGWEFRMLNVYVPLGMCLSEQASALIASRLEPGVQIVTVPEEGRVSFDFSPVGFDLAKEDFLFLKTQLRINPNNK